MAWIAGCVCTPVSILPLGCGRSGLEGRLDGPPPPQMTILQVVNPVDFRWGVERVVGILCLGVREFVDAQVGSLPRKVSTLSRP